MIRNSILSTAEIFFDSTHLEIELVPIFSKFGSNENWVNIWYDPFENAGSDNKSISTNKYSFLFVKLSIHRVENWRVLRRRRFYSA